MHSSNTDWVIRWTSKINPLINPLVNPVYTKDKTYYYKIWDSVQSGYIPNFIFTALVMIEILAEIVKLTH